MAQRLIALLSHLKLLWSMLRTIKAYPSWVPREMLSRSVSRYITWLSGLPIGCGKLKGSLLFLGFGMAFIYIKKYLWSFPNLCWRSNERSDVRGYQKTPKICNGTQRYPQIAGDGQERRWWWMETCFQHMLKLNRQKAIHWYFSFSFDTQAFRVRKSQATKHFFVDGNRGKSCQACESFF